VFSKQVKVTDIYDNDLRSIIDMNSYKTFSTLISENKHLHFTL